MEGAELGKPSWGCHLMHLSVGTVKMENCTW